MLRLPVVGCDSTADSTSTVVASALHITRGSSRQASPEDALAHMLGALHSFRGRFSKWELSSAKHLDGMWLKMKLQLLPLK